MHFYRKNVGKLEGEGESLFTVGYWAPPEQKIKDPTKPGGLVWVPLVETTDEYEACAWVNYLNGGDGKKFDYRDPDKDLRDIIRDRKLNIKIEGEE